MFSVPTKHTIFRLFIGVFENAEYTGQLIAANYSFLSYEKLFTSMCARAFSSLEISRAENTSRVSAWNDLDVHWVNTERVSDPRSLFMKSLLEHRSLLLAVVVGQFLFFDVSPLL